MKGLRIDSADRGLLTLAWRGGRPIAAVSEGKYQGMTPAEVAERVGCSIEYAREELLDGFEPRPARPGRRISPAGMARRREAGIPEELLEAPAAVIAEKLRISPGKLHGLLYR